MSMTTPADALASLRDLAASGELGAFCERHAVALLVAFGSTVDPRRADQTEDLDLAVSWLRGAEHDVIGLITELMILLDLDGVDVMELDRAGIVARDEALTYGIPLYEREAGSYARQQMAALTHRMDSWWLRRLSLETMAR